MSEHEATTYEAATDETPGREAPERETTAAFRAARDLLLAHRDDYEGAYEKFTWPALTEFNWALDWFDVIAERNEAPALRIIEPDGSQLSRSFAQLSQRSNQ